MVIEDLKYNYVVYGSDWDLYRFSYSDLFDKDNVLYCDTLESVLGKLSVLHKFHFSEKTNRHILLPFKNFWNPFYFKNRFKDKSKPVCFVFMGYWPRIVESTNWLDFLKRQNTHTRCVLFLQDLVKTKHTLYDHQALGPKHFKDYDLVLSFDHGDCKQYGFIYHPLVFSKYQCSESKPKYDVYFLGQAKNRLAEIIAAYDNLRGLNLNLDFNIIGAPVNKQVYKDNINYIKGTTYLENLKHVENARCILEIMQKGGTGFTQRGCEAVCLNKMLLTNNKAIAKDPFYNSQYIRIYDNISDVDDSFVDSLRRSDNIDYHYADKMSPIELLQFIDRNLI